MLIIFLRFLFGLFYLSSLFSFVLFSKPFFLVWASTIPAITENFRDVIIVNSTENSLTSFILFLTIERGYILFFFLLQTTHSWKALK